MEEYNLLNQVAALLQQRGYAPFLINGRTGSYIRENDNDIYLIILNAYVEGMTLDDYERIGQSIGYNVVTRYKKRINTLFLIVNRDGMFDDSLTYIVSKLSGAWLLAADTGKIYIFENQPLSFDGDLNDYLEHNLFRYNKEHVNTVPFRVTPVNVSLVALNIIVFIAIIIFNGDLLATYDTEIMLKMGALSYNTFIDGKWYEIITSMFLHFGITHLFNNMLLLIYVGCELEKRIGSFKYLIVYMISGMVGNIASLWYYSRIGELDVASAGASGAIFGVVGCLAIYLLVIPSKNRNLTTRRLIIMAGLTIYYGLTSVGIDNAAHIGGFCCGLISGFLLSKILYCDKLGTVEL